MRSLFEEARIEGHFVIGENNRGRGTEASKGRVQGRGLLGNSGEEVTGIS